MKIQNKILFDNNSPIPLPNLKWKAVFNLEEAKYYFNYYDCDYVIVLNQKTHNFALCWNLEECARFLEDKIEEIDISDYAHISNDGLRELYVLAYNDGYDNKANKANATELINKRIKNIKKLYCKK